MGSSLQQMESVATDRQTASSAGEGAEGGAAKSVLAPSVLYC